MRLFTESSYGIIRKFGSNDLTDERIGKTGVPNQQSKVSKYDWKYQTLTTYGYGATEQLSGLIWRAPYPLLQIVIFLFYIKSFFYFMQKKQFFMKNSDKSITNKMVKYTFSVMMDRE